MIEFDQEKLERLREAAGLTTMDLAVKVRELTGVTMTPETMRKYERRIPPVQFPVLAGIAKVLGVRMETLFKNGRKSRGK